MKLGKWVWVLAAGLLCLQMNSAFAEEETIGEVVIKGNRTVAAHTVLSQIQTQPGKMLSDNILSEDLKRLYGMGFFKDVKVNKETDDAGKVRVIFVVTEKPVLGEVSISGNQVMKTKDIEKVLVSKIGSFVDDQNIRNDENAIRKLYEEKGFFGITVRYRLDLDPATNRASLILTIEEGLKYRITKIKFEGLKSVKEKTVKDAIETKEAWWFFRPGLLKQDVLELDVERVKLVLEEQGFSDVKVSYRLDESGAKPTDKILVFIIEEGTRYLVGEASITGNTVFTSEQIIKQIEMKPGQPFSRKGFRGSVQQIQDLYFEKGYMNAKILFDSLFNQATGRVDTKYTITENQVTYVNRVAIRGNTKTKDVVIRRELRAYPSEPFNGPALKRSKERLLNLGYFEDVQFDIEDTEDPNRKDLVVTVKETKTGEFSFGGGFSSIDQLLGFVQIRQRNFDHAKWPGFTGAGEDLILRLELSEVRSNGELSWTDPWFMGNPFSFGFDLYRREINRTRSSGYFYDEERNGIALRLGKELTDFDKTGITYRFENVEVADIPEEASADLRAEQGESNLSSALLWYTRDTRDNKFVPTHGYILTGGFELFGGVLGGDREFYKLNGSAATYFKHFDNLVLELKLRGGIADAYEDTEKVPIFERYYAGGANTIRGYRERRVGPRDPISRDPIGGEAYWIFNTEYTFPIFEKLIKGAVFYDVGAVYETMENFENGKTAQGVGVGVRVKTPIGPVKLDLGYPLSEIDDEDKKVRFYFNISRGF